METVVTGAGAVESSLIVALLAPMPDTLVSALEAAGHRVAREPGALWSRATVAVTRGSLPTGDGELARLPRLALLCCWGSGYDGVDLQAAARRGVTVCRAPGGNSASVADLALGFIIALLRRLPEAQAHVRSGDWRAAARRLPAARGLTGARIGVFGVGDVGQRILTLARAFEMELGCCSRRDPGQPGVQYFSELRALAQWCDVLVLAARADASTHHAVDAAVLQALGPQGCLVNVARGSVVDEAALCAALAQRQLAGYASDVFEHEPAIPPVLLAFPNAVLTPHIGGSTLHAQQMLVETLVANVHSFAATGQPLHAVSRVNSARQPQGSPVLDSNGIGHGVSRQSIDR